MKDVSYHIIDAYIIHRQIKETEDSTAENKASDEKHVSYKPLEYAEDAKYVSIKSKANINNYRQFHKKNPKAKQVQKFLSNIKVTRENGFRPTTWIEIFVLYRLRGYTRIIDLPTNNAGENPLLTNK